MTSHDRTTTSFLIPRCHLEQTGSGVLVTLPSEGATWRGGTAASSRIVWTPPSRLAAGSHEVKAVPGELIRLDRADYPRQFRYAAPLTSVRFSGGWCFGRVLGPRGWALQLCGAVASTDLPGWDQFDAVEVVAAPQKVALQGPAESFDPPAPRCLPRFLEVRP